jgi:hypothetical protein
VLSSVGRQPTRAPLSRQQTGGLAGRSG